MRSGVTTPASSRAARRSSRSARPAAGSRRTAPPASVAISAQPGGVAAAGGIGVGRGDQHAGRVGRQDLQKLLQRGDGRRTHAAGGRGIQRVARAALDRRQAQGVDRRLAHRDAGQGTGAARQAEQRLVAARREIALVGAAHLDPGQTVPRRPGARTRRCRAGLPGWRRPRARRAGWLRQSPLFGEIAPGR